MSVATIEICKIALVGIIGLQMYRILRTQYTWDVYSGIALC